MNPFKYRYNLTDVNSGTTFPVELSLTKGSWIKLFAWSFAPFLTVLAVGKAIELAEEKDNLTEDTKVDFPQYD